MVSKAASLSFHCAERQVMTAARIEADQRPAPGTGFTDRTRGMILTDNRRIGNSSLAAAHQPACITISPHESKR